MKVFVILAAIFATLAVASSTNEGKFQDGAANEKAMVWKQVPHINWDSLEHTGLTMMEWK